VAWELCLASEPADPLLCDDSRDACLRGASCLFCGDGIVDSAEECDDGPLNGTEESTCTDVCTVKRFGSIHVFGFLDEDGDGVQDNNEGAFPDDPGKTFELLDENGNVIMTATTVDGMVWFEHLTPGTYTLRENPIPDGFALTTLPNQRTFTIISGQELVYEDGAAMLPAGDQRFETNLGDDLRWGNTELTMLGDFVFEDKNANGIQDSEDMGIPNVKVTLTGGGPDGVIGTPDDTMEMMFTDANGLYKFNNLNPGEEYKVTFTNPDPDGPDAYRFSPRQVGNDPTIDSDGPVSDIVTLASGEFNDTLDAGLFRNGS
jgi:cysteine-rich repeat protein